MEDNKVVNGNFKVKRPAPYVDLAVESRKLLDLYFDRDYIDRATEIALLDGDLTEIWKIRAMALAWKQSPSGSLPAEPAKLARLIAPDAADSWAAVSATVLADWIECNNGRLYHPEVAARIGASWRAYSQKKLAGEASAARRKASREEAKAKKEDEAAKSRENIDN